MQHISVNLLIVSGVIFLALVGVYLRLMLDRTRGSWMRAFFVTGLFGMLGLLCWINLRANENIVFHSSQLICEQRLRKLRNLLEQSHLLNRGAYPAKLEGLAEVPDFRWEYLRCPHTGKPYSYALHERAHLGRKTWIYVIREQEPHRSSSAWLHEQQGRHLMINGRIEWVSEAR